MAVMYLLSAWLVAAAYQGQPLTSVAAAAKIASAIALKNPGAGLWFVALIGAFVFFTDTHVRWYRLFGGITHALAQIGASLALLWGSAYIVGAWTGLSTTSLWYPLAAGALIASGGALIGSWILGIYLMTSLAIYGRHSNEAFSSLRIEDWKQFLRLRIGSDGTLSIFVVGIDRVARRWQKRELNGETTLVPRDKRDTPPHLVETVEVKSTSR
jgi:hypothetical protein